jgi:hypothetical protein
VITKIFVQEKIMTVMQSGDIHELEDVFKNAFQDQIERFEVDFEPACHNQMLELVGAGVQELSESGYTDKDFVALSVTEFLGFTGKMILEAKRAKKPKVDQEICNQVMGFCCPGCWPFC